MSQSQAWMTLFHDNEQADELLKEAKSVKSSSPYFCANGRWLTGIGQPCLKDRVKTLAKGDKEAYSVLALEIYNSLPNCKKCFCKEIGLIPKSSKFLKMAQRFRKLSELGKWCQLNPTQVSTKEQMVNKLTEDLVSYGVEKLVVEAVFIFGGITDEAFLKQFGEVI